LPQSAAVEPRLDGIVAALPGEATGSVWRHAIQHAFDDVGNVDHLERRITVLDAVEQKNLRALVADCRTDDGGAARTSTYGRPLQRTIRAVDMRACALIRSRFHYAVRPRRC